MHSPVGPPGSVVPAKRKELSVLSERSCADALEANCIFSDPIVE